MLAPLCALLLIGVSLLKKDWGSLIAGPAVVLATSTVVSPGSAAPQAPTASPSALVSDVVSEVATVTPQSVVPTTAPVQAPTETALVVAPTAGEAEATVIVAATSPAQPTAAAPSNATAVPATPTPVGAATITAPAPTATTSAGVSPTATAGPPGWLFRGLNIVPTLVGDETQLSLMVELVNTSDQNQAITSIEANVTFSDSSTRIFGGQDVYWPTQDVDFASGLAPQGTLPVEIMMDGIADGVSVKSIDWRVQATPAGDIGRTDLKAELLTNSEKQGELCAYYQVTIPTPAIDFGYVVGFWVLNDTGAVIGINYRYENAQNGLGGILRPKPLCAPLLSGDEIGTLSLAVWGQ